MERSTKITLGVLLAILIGGFGFTYLKAPGTHEDTSKQSSTMSPLTDADWQIKAEGSTVTFTEYADFQCPACGAFSPLIETLQSEYAGRVTFAFRHFPLPMHLNAVPAATAAEAAGAQGKFFEMGHMLFSKQEEWSASKTPNDLFIGYAKELGLDTEKFTADINNPALKEKIIASYKEGAQAKVNATPTFFINGKKIETPKGSNNQEVLDGFKKLIDQALASSGATQTAATTNTATPAAE